MKTIIRQIFIAFIMLFLISGCYKEMPIPGQILIETPDWDAESHGAEAAPDYDMVFPRNQVNRIDIIISPKDWNSFWSELEEMLGPFGRGHMPGSVEGKEAGFISCDFFFNDKQWYKVGIRAKGNSSLKTSWANGIKKIPFKLDFDEFEDICPDIKDQRFYGFEQLSLKNAFSDPSLVREKVIDEVFAEAGLPSVRAAYYRVYIDYGSRKEYFGLYTLVEDVDDVFLSREFEDPAGYLYKPEGRGARLDIRDFNINDFEQHQDGELSDYSDINQLMDALHDPIRNTNPASWRSGLEQIFDTRMFLRWLACNTSVQNWDEYGMMHHNYYLYHDPLPDNFVWIHWDNNEAMMPAKGNRSAPDFGFETVSDEWPLIRFLIDDPEYETIFKEEVDLFIHNIFYPEKIMPIIMQNMDLIAPYVVGDEGEKPPYTQLRRPNDFNRERNFIRDYVINRYNKATDYLKGTK